MNTYILGLRRYRERTLTTVSPEMKDSVSDLLKKRPLRPIEFSFLNFYVCSLQGVDVSVSGMSLEYQSVQGEWVILEG